MAKENYVHLHGQVRVAPKIYANTDGDLVKGAFILKTLRRPIINGDSYSDKLYFDSPIVITRNPELINKCYELQENDMVDVKGVITTKEVIKTTVCPNCKQKTSTEGNTVYVTPIYICKREAGISQEKGLQLLKERSEISNIVMIIGALCRAPDIYTNEKEQSYAQYQLAVNRKYKIKEDSPDLKTDYPWVKTFGQQALKDAEGLQLGSVIFINGAIQTREIKRTRVCEHCGEEYEWDDAAIEIVPYSTEYLANCILPEPEEGDEVDAEES